MSERFREIQTRRTGSEPLIVQISFEAGLGARQSFVQKIRVPLARIFLHSDVSRAKIQPAPYPATRKSRAETLRFSEGPDTGNLGDRLQEQFCLTKELS